MIKLKIFSPKIKVIVSSHSELRCPECRVLVDIKVEDLPPNVLLMRILEGMKNATSACQNQLNDSNSAITSPTQPATDNNPLEQQLQSLSLSAVPATMPSTQQPLQPMSLNQSNTADGQYQISNQTNSSSKSLGNCQPVRANDDSNIMRQMHQQQQQSRQSALSSSTPNHGNIKEQMLPSAANSLPHAKALYDFVSKETG